MKKIIDFLLRIRVFYIIFIVLLTLFFASGTLKLQIQGDVLKALPPQDPYVKLFDKIGDEFEGNMLGMVILKGNPDVFNKKTFRKIHELTEEYKKIEGVSNVISITDIMDIKKIEGGIEVGKLLPAGYIPETKEEYDSLKNYVMSKKRLKGVIVSEDGKYASIIIRFSKEKEREKTALKIREITEKKKGDFKVYYSGFPFIVIFVNETISREVIKLIPFAGIVLALILFSGFRNLQGVLLPLTVVLISIIWTLGLMGYLNVPLSIVSNILPVVLLVVGSAYGIHLLNKYREFREGEKEKNIKETVNQIWVPIFMAGITTFFGFLSLIFTQLDVIKKFGIFSSIGVIFALILTLTLIPVILSFIKTGPSKKYELDFPPEAMMVKFSKIIKKGRDFVIKICLILTITSILGILKITREVDMLSYFPWNNPVRIYAELVKEKFGGSSPSYIVFETDDIKNPLVLKIMRYVEKLLEKNPHINHPQSIADLIAEMNELLTDYNSIPESKEKIDNLYFLLEGQPQIDMMITKDGKKAVIQAVSGIGKTKTNREVAQEIEKILNKLDTTYLIVDSRELNPAERKKIFKEYVKFYARIICEVFDLKDTSGIYKLLYSFSQNKKFENLSKKIAFEKLDGYFKSDEAFIKIEDVKKRERIIREILKGKDIQRVLEKYFKNYDKEDIEATCADVKEILKEAKREGFVKNSIRNFKKGLPEGIEDYIYEFTGDRWILPYKRELKKGEFVKLKFYHSGLPLIYTRLDENLLKSQFQSLFMVMALVFVLVSIEWRSGVGGLISIIPIAFTILLYFGLLGFLKIPLDTVTVMIAPIVIGIGIDYTIHVLSRLKKEIKDNNYEEAFEMLFKTTGRAVLINALSVGLGFLVLIFGNLIPIKRFGLMTFIAMLISSLSALLFLPVLVFLIKPKFLRKR